MTIDEYKATLHAFQARTPLHLSTLAMWAETRGLPFIWSELSGIFKRAIKPLTSKDALRQGLIITPTDAEKMIFTRA